MSKACKWCGGTDHTQFYCRQKARTPIKRNTALVVRSNVSLVRQNKPIRRLGKQHQLWMATRKLWFELYYASRYYCHYCGIGMLKSETTLDHLIPRSRRPDLRYVLWNLVSACGPCNTKKGSKPHDKYKHVCHTPLPISEPIEKPILELPSPAMSTPLVQN